MKKLQLVALGLVAGLFIFSACSDDDDNPVKTISFSQSASEYKIWVGGSTGGQEVSTTGLSTSKIFGSAVASSITDDEADVKTIVLTFDSDNHLTYKFNEDIEGANYKFVNDTLYVQFDAMGAFEPVGVGSKDNLTVFNGGYMHYECGDCDEANGDGYKFEGYVLNDALIESPFASLADMTSVSDTLAVYNVKAILK